MRKKMQNNDLMEMIFGLKDENVEFRTKWRIIAIAAAWLVLSGLTMILTSFGAGGNEYSTVIVIVLSFLKYIPLLFVAYSLSKKMAARYLEDVYELDDEELASKFIEDIAFGNGNEKIVIDEGKITEADEMSPLILIGGPGSIQVNLDSVALLEKVNGEPKVIHPRSEPWKLGRFERVREIGKSDQAGEREYAIINLRDQFASGLSLKSRTKDGIPIEAQDIKIIFSILRKKTNETASTQNDTLLFAEGAVQALVYNQTTITPEASVPSGITFPWDSTIIPLINSELEELIKSHTLSEILASISQKEVDNASNNDQTIAQMRVELTGQHSLNGEKKESVLPHFKSRSTITAQFFEKKFTTKAALLGVSVEWIDIGTWQLPSYLIHDKLKDALNLSRDNAKKRSAVEKSKKTHEMAEVIKLINSVVIENYEKGHMPHKGRDVEKDLHELGAILVMNPELKSQFAQRDASKKDAITIAQEILKTFRKEMIAAKLLIEKDSRPLEEKQAELAKIEKALYDISYLTNHWIKKPS